MKCGTILTAMLAFLLGAFVALGPSIAQEDGPPPLSKGDRAKLQRDKVLVTNHQHLQCFKPYINSKVPVFITSDALLNAFHVLLEESMARLESAQARRLAPLLRHLWERLPKAAAKAKGEAALNQAALRRATLILAVAMELLGERAPGLAADLEPLVKAETAKVIAGTGSGKPEWLGPPDPAFIALNYGLFSPQSFYARNERLQRYFRAAKWLQTIPFRASSDEELLAALLLANALVFDEKRWKDQPLEFAPYFSAWTEFFGDSRPDFRILSAGREYREYLDLDRPLEIKDRLSEIRKLMAESAGSSVNDLERLAGGDGRLGELRVLPSANLPDAALFQEITDPVNLTKPSTPNGMNVAFVLGSNVAKRWVKDRQPEVADYLELKYFSNFRGVHASLYGGHLGVLETLVGKPDQGAPAFMRSAAWQRKSCNTALAGWAQMRHAVVLQAKQTAMFHAIVKTEPGFVEPNPEFFRSLGGLAEDTLKFFNAQDALRPNTVGEIISDLEQLHGRLAAGEEVSLSMEQARERLSGVNLPEMDGLERAPDLMNPENETPEQRTARVEKYRAWQREYHRRLAKAAARVIDELQRADEPARNALAMKMWLESPSLLDHWLDLIKMCGCLEVISRTELRKVELSGEDRSYIQDFGRKLARIIFYDGNSYLAPNDDAMKTVSVFSSPAGFLHASIGRPRAIYVLYPWKGKEILCHGAVLPYHECLLPAPITDEAWKESLDGPLEKRPPVPEWFAPLLGEEGLWRKEEPPQHGGAKEK